MQFRDAIILGSSLIVPTLRLSNSKSMSGTERISKCSFSRSASPHKRRLPVMITVSYSIPLCSRADVATSWQEFLCGVLDLSIWDGMGWDVEIFHFSPTVGNSVTFSNICVCERARTFMTLSSNVADHHQNLRLIDHIAVGQPSVPT